MSLSVIPRNYSRVDENKTRELSIKKNEHINRASQSRKTLFCLNSNGPGQKVCGPGRDLDLPTRVDITAHIAGKTCTAESWEQFPLSFILPLTSESLSLPEFR